MHLPSYQKLKGFDYTELTDRTNGGRSIEDITKISDKAVEHINCFSQYLCNIINFIT